MNAGAVSSRPLWHFGAFNAAYFAFGGVCAAWVWKHVSPSAASFMSAAAALAGAIAAFWLRRRLETPIFNLRGVNQ